MKGGGSGNPVTVRAELVEALCFSSAAERKGQAFDKLRPNGVGLRIGSGA